ncbi:MAG: transcription termination/antitermination NusG family protein [Ruthenibacterium sp.]
MMNIYVLQVITGEELSVRDALIKSGITAYVPRENKIIRVRGEWKKEEQILFPSYIFVGCTLTDEIYYQVKAVSGVIKFLGTKTPEPISEAEAIQIGMLSPTADALEPSVIEFDEHGTPRIVSGILTRLQPIKIDRHARRALVKLSHKGINKYYPFSFVTDT